MKRFFMLVKLLWKYRNESQYNLIAHILYQLDEYDLVIYHKWTRHSNKISTYLSPDGKVTVVLEKV
jgi:hypothetical protein